MTAFQWPPDFETENQRRQKIQQIINSTPDPRKLARCIYKDDPVTFIQDNCITYDPRNAGTNLPTKMPFVLFPKQVELVLWLRGLVENQDDGLIEKTRDMGATWVGSAFSVWMWLYMDGSSIGWGSRKELLVDRLGEPDSIFEKLRMIIRSLPWYMLPTGFKENEHLTYMKCINPENGSTITGEAGKNIGRGGRKTIYMKDESAHYERPELIEAALGDNTDVQVDISSVNGEGNIFHRKRIGGIVNVFIMDWRHHPAKTQEWYEERKRKAESEGTTALFAQEVDRDYSASVEGIFIPAKYVRAAIDAHKILGIEPSGEKRTGLDVADEGGDKNALVSAHGVIVQHIEQWGEGDTDYTAKKANEHCISYGTDEMQYDSIGVGAGVKGSIRAISDQEKLKYQIHGFAAGGAVVNPDDEFTEGKKNKDMFANIKAQAMWGLYTRFYNTYKAVVEKHEVDLSNIICIPSQLELAEELVSEISRPKKQYDAAGKIKVEKKEDMAKRGIKSPNLLEALMICYAPKELPPKIHIG